MEGKGNMERDIEKDLIEIECAIKSQEEKDNIFTMSVLQRCRKLVSQLKEYKDLEKQGKLLKLPCAVGDMVYTNTSMQGWYFRKENRPYEAKIVFMGINGVDDYININFGNGHRLQFKFSDIGKTVFLTKEEAEAALKAIEENESFESQRLFSKACSYDNAIQIAKGGNT